VEAAANAGLGAGITEGLVAKVGMEAAAAYGLDGPAADVGLEVVGSGAGIGRGLVTKVEVEVAATLYGLNG
jgi:hypothetical protein